MSEDRYKRMLTKLETMQSAMTSLVWLMEGTGEDDLRKLAKGFKELGKELDMLYLHIQTEILGKDEVEAEAESLWRSVKDFKKEIEEDQKEIMFELSEEAEEHLNTEEDEENDSGDIFKDMGL